MANAEECREALEQLSRNIAKSNGDVRKAAELDRSLSCRITDLDLTFTGRLRDGSIQDLGHAPGAPTEKADIRLTMSSDDLVAVVGGRLGFASAWAGGRIKLEAGFRDLLRLRTLL
ncbi:SCP2 sterol-binding domain-containing protein [Streptomyces sp. BE20]|uniref:alkyl sulfatase C-terminal domain-containing protein n=1 Tax=Streptomycetaceae TaxID=2062 RepID=UPI002E79AAF8|nr:MULTISPECIES: alkyl sulfatase C-terminal domain-containing protein [unclassified Streptomyces]MED7948253.1 SCP2 sterol-binding domain-containing protein [Streptomyces sp. BE303]MEE1820695.1 SCP2 sterol-binding domain-containing protein [Streptomyces sp. BE20]